MGLCPSGTYSAFLLRRNLPMKHKLSVLSVILALLALVLVFTSCSTDGNVQSVESTKPITITIYSIAGEGTTQAAIQRVQDEMNKITESLYKIHVVLKFYPADEYEAALMAAIQANENADEIIDTEKEDEVVADTVVNEYGRPITIYPDANENQMDIFLIPEGVSKFDFYTQSCLNYTDENGELVEMGGVAVDLNSHLTENGKGYELNQYIPAKVLDFCRLDSVDSASALYGIPSNRYYGEAEYMLINKALFEEYNYDPSIITDMASVQQFLVDVAADCKSGKLQNVVPLYNTPAMNLLSVTGTKSVITSWVSNTALVSGGMYTPMNIFQIPAAQKGMSFVSAINEAGGIMPRVTDEIDFNSKFGAAFVYGSADVVNKYADDYHIIMNNVPYIDGEDIYKGIYAVSNYASEYADRCIQILTCMNTNKTFRNLFGYGVENVNYYIDEETGLVVYNDATEFEIKNKETGETTVVDMTYNMDLEATGNMFLLMQNAEMDETEMTLSNNNWAVAKATNNLAIVSPYAKFTLNVGYFSSDYSNPAYVAMPKTIPELEKLYDEIWVWIAEYPTYVNPSTGEKLNTFSEYLLVLKDQLDKNLYVSSASSTEMSTSLKSQYTNWYGVVYGDNPNA